ncbi:HRDC domain-containing protein [Georgenia sp. 10Sc9-8]|uniref:HRDC domain-containing protein n=1 Tax=Georgenia halotolerans TaxID=3028317 RepID=A0ABT5TXT8_9MICO|nr:HRDC domain-containing protein [Georgenia halotolerans]
MPATEDTDLPVTVPLTEPADGVPPVCETPAQLDAAAAALAAGTGPVAVDAERASGFRYGQRAYLVQLRRAGAGTVLVDPVALPDLSLLQQALDGTEWVLHAADQDLPCLAGVGLVPAALFDTELASRLLGRQRVGLAAIVAEELGFALAKEHSAADWSTRPLPEAWLRYAALDVELLVELRERLSEQLASAGKLEWAHQEFEHVRTAPPSPPKTDPWRRVAGATAVRSPRGLAVLRELWQAREDEARRRDRAPGRVLPNAALVAAAQAQPRTTAELVALPPFAGKGTRRHARTWQEAITRALALPEEQLPPRRPPVAPGSLPAPRSWPERNPAAAARLDAVRTAVRARAEELQLPQENLLSPELQRQLAWHAPDDAAPDLVADLLLERGARPWQVELLHGPLAGVLAASAEESQTSHG